MKVELIHITGTGLNSSIKKAYRAGIASIVRLNKDTLLKFSEDTRKLFEVDYSLRDLTALQNFRVEAFTVAGVGVYELEEKLKEIAIDIQKSDDISDPFKEFERRSREEMNNYVWNDKQPPSGYLKTNLQTAVTSSYRAAEWIRVTDPDIAGVYSYLQYKTVSDDRVRETHAALHNAIFLTADPIWDTIYPPNGWNCRCYTNPLTNDEVPATQGGMTNDQERQRVFDQAKVEKDFNRNPGKTNSIWDKWLDSKLKEIDTEQIFASMREYANTNISTNYTMTPDMIGLIRNALGSEQRFKQVKDYDDNAFLSIEDDETRKLIDPIFKEPHEVWGKSYKSNEGRVSEINYIKYTTDGIAIAMVKAGKVTDIRGAKIEDLNKFRKGILMYKNFK